jgi:tetratricopeptide (TPR) repeat protein
MDCPEENALVDFARGELDDATRDQVEAHLDGCELCCAVMVELARFEPESDELAVTDQSIAPEPVEDPTRDPSAETFKVAPRLAEGDKVGRYVVLGKVGEGGMGVVYAAYDPELDRKVAIKLLMTSLGGSLDAEFAEQRTRLLREAQAMARLTHSNVITVHDVGEFGDQVFVAMEFVEGGTLTEWLETHRPWRERLAIFLAAGRGLAAAHSANLVHRDFKPDNVLIDAGGRAAVTDFGLARPLQGKTDTFNSVTIMESTPVMSAQLTRTGALVGTPAYMAPEQLAGQRSTALSDQFSFCVTLYEALYGHRPFEGRVLGELMANVSAGRILPPPRDNDVPRRIRRAIVRGLSVAPEDRFPTMEALLAELSHDPARTWRRWGTVLLPSAVLGVGLLAYQQSETRDNAFCDDLDAHLRGVWDDDRKATVEAAFLNTERAFAANTWEGTRAAIDDYVGGWMNAQRDACELSSSGTVPKSVMALRMQCLEQQRQQLGTLVGVLQNIDAAGLERARDAVDMLVTPQRCEDINALALRDANLDTAEKRALREDIDALNTRAFALRRTGNLERAAEAATEALDKARTGADRWGEAEALINLAEAREYQGRFAESEDLQHQAMSAAIASRHDAVIVRTAVGRVWAGQDPGASLVAAERWYQHGLAAWNLAGRLPVHRNQLENGLANAYMGHDAFEEARAHIDLALEAHRRDEPGAEAGSDSTWGTLGRLHGIQGQLDEAEEAFTRSLQITEERYGATHPFVANGLENLGAVAGNKNEHEKAKRLLERALELRRIAMGDDHPDNASSLLNLANVERHLGNYEGARKKLTEALAVIRVVQPGSTDEADLLRRLGDIQRELRLFDEALASQTAALELVNASEGMSRISRSRYVSSVARTLLARGEVQKARPLLEEATALVEGEDFDALPVVVAWVLWGTANPQRVTADKRAFIEDAARGAAEVQDPLMSADGWYLRARLDRALGDRTAARRHADKAREILEGLGVEGALHLRRLDTWQAEAF